jgi:hypothetical protein
VQGLKQGAFQLWASMGQGESTCTAPPRASDTSGLKLPSVSSSASALASSFVAFSMVPARFLCDPPV